MVTALIRIHRSYVKLKCEIIAQCLGKGSQTKNRNDLLHCNIQATKAERKLIINPKDQMAHDNLLKAKKWRYFNQIKPEDTNRS